MIELKNEQKIVKLTFSSCSDGALREYLARLHVGYVRGNATDLPAAVESFDPFHWVAAKEPDIPNAKEHLQTQLGKFGVQFGSHKYELYDVHSSKTILSLDDPKTGVLKGGTDLILGPEGLHLLGVVQQTCVAFELKTEDAVREKRLKAFLSQATLELIAANYFSNQMTVVVLTDLCTAASILTLRRVPNTDDLNVVVYEDVSLSKAAQFVANHLSLTCVPSVDYRLGVEGFAVAGEAVEVLQVFKRARVSALEDSVVWEHFQEMIHDSAPGTRERAEAINGLYRACDFPQPAWLSMYAGTVR